MEAQSADFVNGSSNIAVYCCRTIPKHTTQWRVKLGATGTTVGTSWSREKAAEQFVFGIDEADEAVGRAGLSVDG